MTNKPSDFELWTDLTRTVQPLRKARAPGGLLQGQQAEAEKSFARVSAPPIHVPPRHSVIPPPITGLDRRTSQKLTRGNVALDTRIDLHGMGIETARLRLLQFLHSARNKGYRTILVITGKGDSPYARHTLHGSSHFDAPERQGRLRRYLAEWLHEPEFRALVSGYQPAHPKHGGGGAFYVRLRRA